MVTIGEMKQLREKHKFTHLVLIGIHEDNSQQIATHGLTAKQAEEASKLGNNLKKHLGWSEEMCNATPLKRECGNCEYFQERPHGSFCMYRPMTITRGKTDRGCLHFTPNC